MFGGSSGRLPTVMAHNFSQVPDVSVQRSSFDRSHGCKLTFDAGYLVPFFVDEALPGDTFNLKVSTFARLATPLVPVMDNMYCDTFFFAVPIRLIWENWQKFNGEQLNPGDSTVFLVPQMVAPAGGYAVHSLADYFGIPTGIAGLSHSALWHRAYNLIYREWFRDENLQNSPVVDIGDAASLPANYPLRKRGKRHDYFTSCLPWAQKGTAVQVPLGSSAPVVSNNLQVVAKNSTGFINLEFNPGAGQYVAYQGAPTGGEAFKWGHTTGMVADLSTATAATINSLRQAFQIQRLYERDARGGTRYTEIVRSHFGVVSPDARLQRPEYLGGGSAPISFTPIPQTSPTSGGSTPQGNLAGFATFSHGGNGFTKSFTEHCVLLGLVSVRADLNYQQGLNRMFSRRTRWDFYWPALSHLGEQAVLNKEIYAQNDANDDLVFGYQERYAEYRYKPSQICGHFRSTYATPLDIWHLAQKFTALPTLGDTFIQESPPVDRVVAVAAPYPQFLCDCYFQLKCARPMPTFSVPGMIDHF